MAVTKKKNAPRESTQPKKKAPREPQRTHSVLFCTPEATKQQVQTVSKPSQCPQTIKFKLITI